MDLRTNDDQYWSLERVAGGNGDRVRVRNLNSGKCLAIGGSSTANGANAIQWTCGTNTEPSGATPPGSTRRRAGRRPRQRHRRGDIRR